MTTKSYSTRVRKSKPFNPLANNSWHPKEKTQNKQQRIIYGSREGTIQKYFANPKKYFKSQCFSQITVEKFDKSKKLLQILRKFVDPQITFFLVGFYEEGKTKVAGENLSEQWREQMTNSTQIWRPSQDLLKKILYY